MMNGHGSDAYRYGGSIEADFSSNIFYGGLSFELSEYLQSRVAKISDYPEPDAGQLQLKIAEFHTLRKENVVVTNGSTEVFYMLAHLFQYQKSCILTPSFAEYEDACKMYRHEIKYLSNSAFITKKAIDARVIWICNPNNPDGKTLSQEEVIELCKVNQESVIILDEAYAELCFEFASCVSLIGKVPNLIIVKSLTKAFAVPGLRLGYALLCKQYQQELSKLKIPWSVSSLAIDAGHYILDNFHRFRPDVNEVFKQSIALQNELGLLEEIKVLPSKCNYFLCKLTKGAAKSLQEYLVIEHKLLIRNASNFRGLDDSYFRLAVQSEEKNKKLIKGIKEWLSLK